MSRFRRFERLEKQRPAGSAASADRPSLSERFGAAERPAPPAADSAARSNGAAERFGSEPTPTGTLRVLELDDGQPFVRCADCHVDSYVTATTCSHCGADLTTQEQRVYNEAYWRRWQAELAGQREQLAKMEAARAQGEREAAEARRRIGQEILEARRRAGEDTSEADGSDSFRAAARGIGRLLGTWLRRTFPNRIHRIVFAVAALIALGGLAAFVAASPRLLDTLWRSLFVAGILAGLLDRFRRSWRG